MQIILGNCSADPKVLDKRRYFTGQSTVNVQIYDNCSLEFPRLKMRTSELRGKNYAYIPDWDAYYYVGNAEVLNGDMCVLPLSKDYLTSSADAILQLNVSVGRSQSKRADFAVDSGIITSVKNTVYTFQFDASPFNVSGGYQYVLAVVGGNL